MFCLLVLLLFDSGNGMDIEKVKELKDVKVGCLLSFASHASSFTFNVIGCNKY